MPYQHTEWWDEGEPELKFGQPMDDEHVDKAYSELYVGCRVRWTTPSFVKRGTIKTIGKRTLTVLFDEHTSPTVIPDAKWYFVEGKMGNKQEHLVVINTSPPVSHKPKRVKKSKGKLLTPAQAASAMGVDAKKVRRMIRSGKLPAHMEGGRWVIDRSDLP